MSRIIIIGGVAAGATAASKARRCCADREIELYDKAKTISYAGCGLPYMISGVVQEEKKLIARKPEQFKKKDGVTVFTEHNVEGIDTDRHMLRIRDLKEGRVFEREYAKLLIATGASPFVPSMEGKGIEGVFTLRSFEDAIAIMDFIKSRNPKKALIVGAGPIGLEMCESFCRLGMKTTLIEGAAQIAPLIDSDYSERIQKTIENEGVECRTGESIRAIYGNRNVERIATDAEEYEADIVLLAIGIRPSAEIAANAGIEIGEKGAVKVGDGMRTSAEDVFAAGDCATSKHVLTGEEVWIPLGSTSRKQGRVAAETMFGADSVFRGTAGSFVVKVFDMTVGKTGFSLREAKNAGFDCVEIEMEGESLPGYYPGGGTMFAKVIAERRSRCIMGAQMVGDYGAAVERRLDVFSIALTCRMTVDELQQADLVYAPPYNATLDLPIVAASLLQGKIDGKICQCDSEGLE